MKAIIITFASLIGFWLYEQIKWQIMKIYYRKNRIVIGTNCFRVLGKMEYDFNQKGYKTKYTQIFYFNFKNNIKMILQDESIHD